MTDFATRRTMMVDTQIRPSDVTKFPIIDAMLAVPREQFVPADKVQSAYVDGNLQMGEGRVLLEPRTFAKLLDALDIQSGDLVLDLGAGLGYSSAVIARIAEAVVAVEENADWLEEAQTALARAGADNVALQDGVLAEGAPQHGPYDVIILQGSVEQVPGAILDQLKEGGRIGALITEGAVGVAKIGYKIDGAVSWRFAFNAGAPVLPGFEQPRAFAL